MITRLKNKKVVLSVGILCAAALLLFYFMSENTSENTAANAVQPNTPRHNYTEITADRATFGDLKGLVGISDFVVTGHYENQIQTIKNTNGSGTYYSEADTYRFVVEDHLLGSTPAEIEVYMPHFSRKTATVNGIKFQADIEEPHYLKPDQHKLYILFLKGVPGMNIYSPSSAPFQIEIDADKSAQLMYNKTDLNKTVTANNGDIMEFVAEPLDIHDQISGKKLNDVLKQIKTEIVSNRKG
ncbi:hypothetical protein [Paenibacillus nasutitermitis]|uniref:Uncharacterized protein n=1 Tax=Paenibacillus nasutitermitis TaxID=1652958 RepID=A0A916ZBP3_9BACL|nr:hypothetical protein [Paenibacillus nasutitermitis]GGD86656.1 hypothetical protein GCM10010911_51400 [Paenibacillus nasutitermitis]